MWSFGILCVEIFQDGLSPWTGLSMPAVMQRVTTGGIHPRPPNCTAANYDVLVRCWSMRPEDRPTFHELDLLFRATEAAHGAGHPSRPGVRASLGYVSTGGGSGGGGVADQAQQEPQHGAAVSEYEYGHQSSPGAAEYEYGHLGAVST